MKTIAICAFKGGVGKTTTALNIAAGLARTGNRNGADVLALDLDRTSRTLTSFTGAVERVRVQQTTPGRLAGIAARGAFDFAVLDCPPSLARESASALKIADLVIVPMPPQMPAVPPLLLLLDAVEAARDVALGGNAELQVILLFTMCDKRDTQAAEIEATIREQIAGVAGLEVWPDAIGLNPKISAANNDFRSVLDTAPGCDGARVYRELAGHIALEATKVAA